MNPNVARGDHVSSGVAQVANDRAYCLAMKHSTIQGHSITPATLRQIFPSGRTSMPPAPLYRAPSEPQQPALSQVVVNAGLAGGLMLIWGTTTGAGGPRRAADGTDIGLR